MEFNLGSCARNRPAEIRVDQGGASLLTGTGFLTPRGFPYTDQAYGRPTKPRRATPGGTILPLENPPSRIASDCLQSSAGFLSAGGYEVGYPEPKRQRCLALVEGLPRLAVTPEVIDLAAFFVQHGAMPANDLGDAFHLAFATWYRLQYILIFN
jgi:hypothetical protein